MFRVGYQVKSISYKKISLRETPSTCNAPFSRSYYAATTSNVKPMKARIIENSDAVHLEIYGPNKYKRV